MTIYDFNIKANVHCKDGACGKLFKVIVDPHTHQVTGLVVMSGFLLTTNRVLPIDVVERAAGEAITLSITRETLNSYPEYREIEFEELAPAVKKSAYHPDNIRWGLIEQDIDKSSNQCVYVQRSRSDT